MNKTLVRLFLLLSLCLNHYSLCSSLKPATGIPNIVYVFIPTQSQLPKRFLNLLCMSNNEKKFFLQDNPDLCSTLTEVKLSTRKHGDMFYKKYNPVKKDYDYYCFSVDVSCTTE